MIVLYAHSCLIYFLQFSPLMSFCTSVLLYSYDMAQFVNNSPLLKQNLPFRYVTCLLYIHFS